MLGPRDAVEIPGESRRLDFELEVGAVVGRELRSVSPEDAASAIAGYVVLCDWSARDTQFDEMAGSLGPFKGKDFACRSARCSSRPTSSWTVVPATATTC